MPLTTSPEEMRAFVASDRERWGVLVRNLNIRLELRAAPELEKISWNGDFSP